MEVSFSSGREKYHVKENDVAGWLVLIHT